MRRLLLLFLIAFTSTSLAQAIGITHGPYICDMDSTSVTIVWTTDKPGLSWLELAPDDTDHFYGEERAKYFDTRQGRRVVLDSVHQVRIEGLTPDTRYRYRIFTKEALEYKWGDYVLYGDVAASAVYQHDPYMFKTFPSGKRDMNFLMLNDIHENADVLTKMIKEVDFSKVDFVVMNGDMVSSIEDENELLNGVMDSLVNICATSIPVFLNRGNHETRGKYADQLMRYFPNSSGEFYRLKRQFGIDFLFIDSGEDKPDSDIEYSEIADFDNYRLQQARWLRQLQQTKQVGTHPLIVFSHVPPTLDTWHGPKHLVQTIVPELNKMNVTVMLSGHLHRYAYQEPNQIIHFPNLANANQSYLMCHIHDNILSIDYVDLNPKENRQFTYPLK